MYIEHDIMKKIQLNPDEFVKIKTLGHLYNFLGGYRMCIHDNNIFTVEQLFGDIPSSTKFEKFLYDKFNQNVAGGMDFTTILEYYHPNKKKTFYDAFVFHEEYLELVSEEFKNDLEKYQNIFLENKKKKKYEHVLLNYEEI